MMKQKTLVRIVAAIGAVGIILAAIAPLLG